MRTYRQEEEVKPDNRRGVIVSQKRDFHPMEGVELTIEISASEPGTRMARE